MAPLVNQEHLADDESLEQIIEKLDVIDDRFVPIENSKDVFADSTTRRLNSIMNQVDRIKSNFEKFDHEVTEQFTEPEPNLDLIEGGATLELPTGFRPNSVIAISGRPSNQDKRFTILLIKRVANERPLIALRMDIQFDRKLVIRNSRLANGSYGEEERFGGFPFESGKFFDLSIRSDERTFYIDVNGHQFCSYDHRFEAVNEINLIRVEGGVDDVITQVTTRNDNQ